MRRANRRNSLLFLLLCIGYCILHGDQTSHTRSITVSEANKLDLSHIQEESFPALVFVLGSNCGEECEERKFMDHLSTDLQYSGPVYVVNENRMPWDFPLKLPSILLANAERKLSYFGPLRYENFMDAIQQFSNGVRAARLDDANFEHDTQASTGSTTGHWLIAFDKMTTQTLLTYDSLALRLRSKGVLVGVVDPTNSPRTAKRFAIEPAHSQSLVAGVLMLKRSSLYELPEKISRNDIEALVKFALSEHMQYPSSVIPRPRMRFDELVDFVVEMAIAVERQYGKWALVFLVVLSASTCSLVFVFTAMLCVWYLGGFHSPSASAAEASDDQTGHDEESRVEEKGPQEADDGSRGKHKKE